MTLASRLPVGIATGFLCIAIPIALYAAPGGTRPTDPILRPMTGGPVLATPPRTATRPSGPVDTLGKSEKGKAARSAPAPKKKLLKGRQAAPAATSDPRDPPQFVPDQPWETEFYVDNDVPRPPQRAFLLLASSRR